MNTINSEIEKIDIVKCKPHSVTLKFPIPSLENAFNLSYRRTAVQYYRHTAIYILCVMIALSITGLFVEFSVNPHKVQKILWYAYIPLTVIAIACLSVKKLSRYAQNIVITYVLTAGIIGIIIPRTYSTGFAMYYGHSYLMLICFLLFPLSRIKISFGLLIAIILVTAYVVIVGSMPGYLNEDLLRQCELITGATLFGLSIGYLIELHMRRWYLVRAIIEDRESQLRQEHEKLILSQEKLHKEKELSDSLLLSILPESIVERLKEEGKSIADGIVECTVLFADLVGFTSMAQETGPRALVDILNEIFSSFDDLSAKYNIEKIKTIGDAYMVAGGVPNYDPNHASSIAKMALEMRKFIDNYNEKNNLQLGIRIGIHTGPVIAGIIGTRKFSYDLWGDAVNLASRMESHALPGKIQITEATYLLLKKEFDFEERGLVDIKGKGKLLTYFLIGIKLNE